MISAHNTDVSDLAVLPERRVHGGSDRSNDPATSPALEASLRRVAFAAIVGTLLSAPWPALANFAAPSYALVIIVILGAAAFFTAIQSKGQRQLAAGVFAIAFFLHFAALVLFAWLQVRFEGGYILSSDGLLFYRNSVTLAANQLAITPAVLGSADIGHYLLFSTLIRDLHADVFAIQVFDCGLLAIAASLMVDLRPLVPRAISLALALFVAVFPTLIANAAFDLWKEPSLFLASVLFLWATLKMWRAEPGWRQAGFACLSAIALVYLRCTRFYLVAYIECAVATIGVIALLRHIELRRSRTAVWMLAGAIAVAEVGPWSVGWPLTPELMLDQISYTLHTPLMLHYTPGSFGLAHHDKLLRPLQTVSGSGAAWPGDRTLIASMPPTAAASLESGSRGGVIAVPINLFRRLYGPFIWILPSQLKLQLLFSTDYLLYPGMLIWYVALPFVIAGLLKVMWGAATGREPNLALVALAVFELLYFAQYMAINLSYRHRDIMVPFLMIFAWTGWRYLANVPWRRRAYAFYWLALCVIAAGHLLVRSLLQS